MLARRLAAFTLPRRRSAPGNVEVDLQAPGNVEADLQVRLEEPVDNHIPHAGSDRKNFMRNIGRKRHERSGLWRDVEGLRLIEAKGATLALLACAREKHYDGDAPRELLI